MLRNSKDLEGCAIGATDGTIGEVKDLYFDDDAWVIRYLVVSTGAWLSNRKVLISPYAIGQPHWAERILPASITKEQVKNSPHIDTDKPISRQHEMQYLKYYRYPSYWGGGGLWGVGPNPNMLPMNSGFEWSADPYRQALPDRDREGKGPPQHDDPHLRSCNAVMKYHIRATDGDIGHVSGLLVDDETWAIRYLIIDTSNWWLGHQMLIAPQWIEDVLLGGDEVRRPQGGNNNAYCQDNEPSWLDWTRLERHQEIYRFARGMIAFRRTHPGLSTEQFYTDEEIRWLNPAAGGLPNWFDPQEKSLACLIQENEQAALLLVFNAGANDTDFGFPPPLKGSRWHLAVDTSRSMPQDLFAAGAEVPVDHSKVYRLRGHSSAIFLVRKQGNG